MEDVLRFSAIALVAAIAALTIKRTSPDMSLIISLTGSLIILAGIVAVFGVVMNLIRPLIDSSGLSDEVFGPLIKVVGISLITKLAGELCRDAGESALAAKLDMLGTCASVIAAMPLIVGLFRLIASLAGG